MNTLAAGLSAVVLLASCGDGSGGGAFTPATPPADVCSLLTVDHVETLLPGVMPGVEQQGPDTTSAGYWTRTCVWYLGAPATRSVQLIVFGALTQPGVAGVKAAAAHAGTVDHPVTGIGREAHYWEEDIYNNGLWALDGSSAVQLTTFFVQPFPAEALFRPLVTEVLAAIK